MNCLIDRLLDDSAAVAAQAAAALAVRQRRHKAMAMRAAAARDAAPASGTADGQAASGEVVGFAASRLSLLDSELDAVKAERETFLVADREEQPNPMRLAPASDRSSQPQPQPAGYSCFKASIGTLHEPQPVRTLDFGKSPSNMSKNGKKRYRAAVKALLDAEVDQLKAERTAAAATDQAPREDADDDA